MDGEVFNPKHIEIPLRDQSGPAAAGQSAQLTLESAKLTPVLSQLAKLTPELAKLTSPAPDALEALESAKPTLELSRVPSRCLQTILLPSLLL